MATSETQRFRASAVGLRGLKIHLNWDSPGKAEEKEARGFEEWQVRCGYVDLVGGCPWQREQQGQWHRVRLCRAP